MASPIKIPARRRTVLVVTPYYANHGGSIERIAGQLIKDIGAFDNFHFTWAASQCPSPLPRKQAKLSATFSSQPQDSNAASLLPMRAFNQLERFLGLRWPIWGGQSLRQLKQAMISVDCLWLHDTFSLGSLLAFRMARRQGKPVLITKHAGPTRHPGWLKGGWAQIIDRLITRRLLGHAQQTTFTGDGAAEFYYRRVGFAAPVKIIPNGVDLHIFHAPLPEKRNYLRARFALRPDQPVLLFVGRFSGDNGLTVIRELAKLLPEWRFWLAGEGPINPEKWFLPNLQVFRGRRDTQLAELYQSADLLILPSYRQGFPLAAQEAMACGLPIMCGQAIATESDFAKPYLWVAPVDPKSCKSTAALWAKKLAAGRSLLPLTEAKTELMELAESCWEWPRIAGYYAETLSTICKSA